MGEFMFGPANVKARLDGKAGQNSVDELRAWFVHAGGWLLADITGGREALREMVHPVLRDLVDELEPCDDEAIWREIPTTHFGSSIGATTVYQRVRDSSGRRRRHTGYQQAGGGHDDDRHADRRGRPRPFRQDAAGRDRGQTARRGLVRRSRRLDPVGETAPDRELLHAGTATHPRRRSSAWSTPVASSAVTPVTVSPPSSSRRPPARNPQRHALCISAVRALQAATTRDRRTPRPACRRDHRPRRPALGSNAVHRQHRHQRPVRSHRARRRSQRSGTYRSMRIRWTRARIEDTPRTARRRRRRRARHRPEPRQLHPTRRPRHRNRKSTARRPRHRGLRSRTRPPLTAQNCVGLNGSLQRGVECLGWCHPAEGLSRPSVELACDLVEVALAVGREAGPLREVLT